MQIPSAISLLSRTMAIHFRTSLSPTSTFFLSYKTRQDKTAVWQQLELNTCLASPPTLFYGNNSNLTDVGSQPIPDHISHNLSWHLFPFSFKDLFPVSMQRFPHQKGKPNAWIVCVLLQLTNVATDFQNCNFPELFVRWSSLTKGTQNSYSIPISATASTANGSCHAFLSVRYRMKWWLLIRTFLHCFFIAFTHLVRWA